MKQASLKALDMLPKKLKIGKDWWTEISTHRDRDDDLPYRKGQWSEDQTAFLLTPMLAI